MAKKNESLGEKALRYGGALLTGGIFSVGKEAIDAYKDYQKSQSLENETVSQIEDAIESDEYEESIELADIVIREDELDEEAIQYVKWLKATSYFLYALQIGEQNASDDELDDVVCDNLIKANGLFTEYGNEYGWNDNVFYYVMLINDYMNNITEARNMAIVLMDSDDVETRSKAVEIYKRNTDELLDNESGFTENYPYADRKFVYIGQNVNKIGGLYQWDDEERVIDWIFTLDHLPTDMVFPLGRPQPGLYMAHPVLTDQYYPMNVVEEALFMDKVREFCWLVQCLGAKMVSFHSNKGLSVSEGMGSTMNIGTNVGVKAVEVGASYGNTSNRNEDYNYSQKVELVQHFSPRKKPYCPDDLVWFDSDPAWHMLLKQRIEGGIIEYNYKISSNETCQMTSNEKNEVKTNFGYMMVKVNATFDMSTDQTFSSNEETEWSIHVEFAPMDELTEELNKTKSDNNQNKTTMKDYKKLDAGMSLTEKERKDYAKRINSPFSMEIEDVWELKNYPQNPMTVGRVWSGIIKEGDRVVIVDSGKKNEAVVFGVGMYNPVRKEFALFEEAEAGDACGIMLQDIDADNVQAGAVIYKLSEYSKSANPTRNTDSELEYLEMVKECMEDGEIGARERKLLDKIRVKNGISEERAKELEATLSAPQLTDDEKEYLEAFKDACEDGKVSDKQRRLLEKLRVMYGISEERSRELEKM